MLRKLVIWLVVVPLALIILMFALANRESVTVSFDPFDTVDPAFSLALPLYVLILALVIAGVILGGAAAWMRQGRWRGRARLAEGQAHELRLENEQLKRRDGSVRGGTRPTALDHAPRLRIPPPAA